MQGDQYSTKQSLLDLTEYAYSWYQITVSIMMQKKI